MSIYEELRALDDADEPRSLRFAAGLRLWPYVRWIAFSAAADRALGLQPAFATSQPRSLRQRAELVARAALRGPLSVRGTFDIAFVSSSAGLVERNGRWFDRINDYFALELRDRTLVLDKALHGVYKTPRVPPHVRCFDTFELRASVLARTRRPADADLNAIDQLMAFVRTRFPVAIDDAELAHMRGQLIYWSLRLPLLHGQFASFFDRVRPRLIAIEDGSYGAFTHVNTWAHAAGIATAEPQHGVISRSHLAYNYGDQARSDNELAVGLPGYLLAYGEQWRNEVRTPSKVVVVGSPHFAETRLARGEPSTVLVISQGIVTDKMVRLTTTLARALPALRIVFRPHVGELAVRERYASLGEHANVEIDEHSELYPRIAAARVVLGHSSTAIVEAAGLGVPVLVLDDAQSRAILPASIGSWFRTADEAVPLVGAPPVASIETTRFFALDWRARYRAFVDDAIDRVPAVPHEASP